MRVVVSEPKKNVYEGHAKEVLLPGQDGEIAVLDFHQPFLHRLVKGCIIIKETLHIKGKAKVPVYHAPIAIKRGIAKMLGDELTIMVET